MLLIEITLHGLEYYARIKHKRRDFYHSILIKRNERKDARYIFYIRDFFRLREIEE